MARPALFAVGGAHLDRRGRMTEPFTPGASIPGAMREEVGGGAFNALRNAAQRGVRGEIMSLRGGDAPGEAVARAIAAARISDRSAIFLDRATPSYTALVSREGEVIAGLADMALYEFGFAKLVGRRAIRDAIAAVDAVLCDANPSAGALEKLAALAAAKPIFALAVSPAKVVRLKNVLSRLACLFMNAREAAALVGGAPEDRRALLEKLRAKGLAAGVITAAAAPVVGFDRDQAFSIAPPARGPIADATGAGDALAGATVAALLCGRALRDALREGVAAALLTLESPAAVARLDSRAFAEALALVPEAQDLFASRRPVS